MPKPIARSPGILDGMILMVGIDRSVVNSVTW